MQTTLFFFTGIVLLVLQTTIFQVLPSWLGKPDLYFLLIIFLAWRLEVVRGIFLVIVLGIIMDVFSGVFLGIYPVTYLLIFLLIKGTGKYLPISNSTYQVPMVASSYLIVAVGNYIASYLFSPEPPAWFWPQIVWQVALLSLLSLPVLAGYDFIYRMVDAVNVKQSLSFKSRTSNRFR
jgi:rod shape-determining protein MreD